MCDFNLKEPGNSMYVPRLNINSSFFLEITGAPAEMNKETLITTSSLINIKGNGLLKEIKLIDILTVKFIHDKYD